MALRGLTWDHPRGYRVLEALADALAPKIRVRWARQPLEEFESRPLRTLAGDFDLVVLDYPVLGEAVRDQALRPLDELFSREELAGWRAASLGASFDSYRMDGRQWALPLDAAAQVSATRANRTVLCLGGPHALLMFSAICVAFGAPPATDSGDFVPAAAGTATLEIMADLLAHADRELSQRNPIGVLEAMAAPGGPAYCPLLYGYVTYQRPPARVSFFDAPAGQGGIGSVLGGTGIAVTRCCTQPAAAAAVIRHLLSDPVQVRLFAALGGQSSAPAAWEDPAADQASGGFYGATRATVERAWVRPRFPGYPAFQSAASAVLRDGLLAGARPPALVGQVNEMFARACTAGPATEEAP